MPRPRTKMTPAVIDKMRRLLKAGYSVADTAAKLEVSVGSIYKNVEHGRRTLDGKKPYRARAPLRVPPRKRSRKKKAA